MMTEMQKKGYAAGYTQKIANESSGGIMSSMGGALSSLLGKTVGVGLAAPAILGILGGYATSKMTSPSKLTEEKAQKEIQSGEEEEMYYALLEKKRRAELQRTHDQSAPKARTLHV